MSKLDENLSKLLDKADYSNNMADVLSKDEIIAQIHEAFTGAGYLPIKTLPNIDPDEPLHWVPGQLMTGADWLSRYRSEKGEGSLDNLKDMPHSKDYSDGIDVAVMKCDEAAERAARAS